MTVNSTRDFIPPEPFEGQNYKPRYARPSASLREELQTVTQTDCAGPLWFEMVKTVFMDKEWYDNFRVSKETFQNIVSEIEDEIVRKDTATGKAISSRKKLVWHGQSFTTHFVRAGPSFRERVPISPVLGLPIERMHCHAIKN